MPSLLVALVLAAHAPFIVPPESFPALEGSGTPVASISSVVNGATTYSGSQTVHIWRGEAAQMEVFGSAVGTALGIDIFLADGTTPAPLMLGSIVTRKPSSAVITVDVAAVVNRATYVVRFRYAASVSAPDQFKVRVYDRGHVSSFAATPVTPRAGETITITATGNNLEKARLDLTKLGLPTSGYSMVARSATTLTFTLAFGVADSAYIHGFHFFDEDIGTFLGTLDGGYGGARLSLLVRPAPIITSVTPAATVGSATVTIGGSGLNPGHGWSPRIRVGSMSSTVELPVTVVNGSTLQFQSGASSNYKDLHLVYSRNDGSGASTSTQLPHQVLAQLTPVVQRAGTVLYGSGPADCGATSCPTGSDARVSYLRQHLPNEIQGLWLQPAANTPVLVKHGSNTLTVTSASHNSVTVTIPAGATSASGPITVQTGGGTATSPRVVYYAPPPSGLTLEKPDQLGPTAPSVPVTDGKLYRDTWYRVVGNGLHIIPYQAEPGHVTDLVSPEVYVLPAQPFVTAIGPGWTNFLVPANHVTGPATLTYKHWNGSATIGTFQVLAKPIVVTAVEVAAGTTSWFANGSVQGTVADRTIQSGTTMTLTVRAHYASSGTLPALVVTSSDAAVSVGGSYAFTPSTVSYNPNASTPIWPVVQVPLQVQPLSATRTVTLTFKTGDAPGAVATVPVTLAPVPLPKLESVAFEPTEMTGGTHAKARIVLASAPPVPMALPISSKDAVQLPSSVTLTARETVLQVQTPTVTQVTPVTITVGSGAVARSASLTLYPMIGVQSITPAVSPIPAGSVTDGTLSLDHAAWAPTVVTLTSADPSVLTVPTSVTLQRGERTVRVPLTALTGGPTVVSVNVEARIGTRVHTATIRVGPRS